MKQKATHLDVRRRSKPVKLQKGPKGVALFCPFCDPTHSILPGANGPCGVFVEVLAVQDTLTSHGSKSAGIHCLKCHETGKGDMRRFGSGWVHIEDCAPNVRLLPQVPDSSRTARMIYGLPEKLRNQVEKMTGKVQIVMELGSDGQETGKVMSYFFLPKQKKVKNAQATGPTT